MKQERTDFHIFSSENKLATTQALQKRGVRATMEVKC
ncbi:MAG: hypothetical protein RLZZ504_383 [Bacteroidota bacterium]|jgi:hypothetical protein